MSLDQYSSEKIARSSQIELQSLLSKFKAQHVSVAKFGVFAAYNFIALTGLLAFTSWYVKSKRANRNTQRRLTVKQLSIEKIIKKGTMIGVLIGGTYIIGFLLAGYYTMPISIQETLHSFQIKYDPFYQQILLYRKMKKFGLSDQLISQIKADLSKQKQNLIKNNMLKPQTIQALRKGEQMYSKIWNIQNN